MEPVAVEQAGRPMGRRRFIRMLLGFSLISTVARSCPVVGFLIRRRPAEQAPADAS
jgi:hypothetical protein